MGRVRFALLVATFAAGLTGSALAAPFTNGSFEAGGSIGGSGFSTLGNADTSINGWIVFTQGVDYIGSYWVAYDGSRSIDLNALGPGWVGQTFDTLAGQIYRVSYALAGNPAGGPPVKTLEVLINGVVTDTASFDVTGSTLSAMGWTVHGFLFTATGPETDLVFASTTTGDSGNAAFPNAFGPALDDVQVSAVVPEPASMILLGAGLLLGARRLRRR
jgi:choice-of-anchor C domain-containing protein